MLLRILWIIHSLFLIETSQKIIMHFEVAYRSVRMMLQMQHSQRNRTFIVSGIHHSCMAESPALLLSLRRRSKYRQGHLRIVSSRGIDNIGPQKLWPQRTSLELLSSRNLHVPIGTFYQFVYFLCFCSYSFLLISVKPSNPLVFTIWSPGSMVPLPSPNISTPLRHARVQDVWECERPSLQSDPLYQRALKQKILARPARDVVSWELPPISRWWVINSSWSVCAIRQILVE